MTVVTGKYNLIKNILMVSYLSQISLLGTKTEYLNNI